MRLRSLGIILLFVLSTSACSTRRTTFNNNDNRNSIACDPGSEVDPHDTTRCRAQGFFECRNVDVPDDKKGADVCTGAGESCVMVTAASGQRNIHCETPASYGLPATYGAYRARCCSTPDTSMTFTTEFLSMPLNENGKAVCEGRGKIALSVVSGSGFKSLLPAITASQIDPTNAAGGWAVRCGKFSDRAAKQSIETVPVGKNGDGVCGVVGMKCLNVIFDNYSQIYYCATTVPASATGVAKANCIAPD